MELRGVLECGDVGEIRRRREALQEASQKLAEAVYAQATGAGAVRGTDRQRRATSDDEVVEDADYEVIDEEAKTS